MENHGINYIYQVIKTFITEKINISSSGEPSSSKTCQMPFAQSSAPHMIFLFPKTNKVDHCTVNIELIPAHLLTI